MASRPARTPYGSAKSGEEVEKLYFDSYSHLGIHQEMLQDRVRTEAYREAIFANKSRIEGKVVLDVGCGTGILSIFAAQAGARKVYGVEAAEIAIQATQVVKENRLQDIVTILHQRIEEVELDEEVDVIVSEWMGYMLLYENMLASVIYARDKFLKPGGLILPSVATIYAAPFSNEDRYEEICQFWDNVYDVKMSCMVPYAKKCYFTEPCIEAIGPQNILSWPTEILRVDCNTVTSAETENVKAAFACKSMIMAPVHGLALWFSVEFPVGHVVCGKRKNSAPANATGAGNGNNSGNGNGSGTGTGTGSGTLGPPEDGTEGVPDKTEDAGSTKIVLSTSPEAETTHWLQALLYADRPIEVQQDDVVEGQLTISRPESTARLLDLHLTYRAAGQEVDKTFVMK